MKSLNRWLAISFAIVIAFGFNAPLRAEVRLPQVFGDSMVLQRDKPLPVWGWADPGEKVAIAIGDNRADATADAAGRWRVTLKPMPAGGPHSVSVRGKNTIDLKDVLVGEVWLCSGQSNMQWPLSATQRAGQDIPKAHFPKIRLLTVPTAVAGRPQTDVKVSWSACTPDTARNFSAVAFYFGKELHDDLDVPVGLIHSSWGGTPIEPWTNATGFAAVPALKDDLQIIEKANTAYRKSLVVHLDKVESWLKGGSAWVEQSRKAAAADADLPYMPPLELPVHPLATGSSPTSMYNAMIHPLVPFAMRGVIWYQGESNNGQGMLYYEKMKALIGGWRAAWGQGDFPFLFVQIAPFSGYADGNIEGIWEAQLTSLTIPNTGMAVTTDIVPNVRDIHPSNKHDVGRRLALWARAKTYGREGLVHSGPLFKSSKVEGDKIRVSFNHVGGGLASRDGKELNSFQIGTADGFVSATAKIDGDTVLVWSDAVPRPDAVRFGWNKMTNPNLMNKDGLPASPFRTDCGAFTFSLGKRFLGTKTVEVSAGVTKGTIRYTLDGSVPTSQSPPYAGPIKLKDTATVSARLFGDDGRVSTVARATYTKAAPVEWQGKQLIEGLNYQLYDGEWTMLPDFNSLTPFARGDIDSLTVEPAGLRANYAMRFTGYLDIPTAGEYTFFLSSDDGSKLTIAGKDVLVNDGIHPATEKRSEKVALPAGKHPIVVSFFQRGGSVQLTLAWEGPGLPKQQVPSAALFRTE